MADDVGRIYFFDNHFNDAVVYQNVYARFYVTGQILERDAADLFVTQHIICCQCIGIACFDGDRLVVDMGDCQGECTAVHIYTYFVVFDFCYIGTVCGECYR